MPSSLVPRQEIPTVLVGFTAPPLVVADLAFRALFFVASFVQLVCAVTYLFRGRSPHLLPGVGGIVAFLFLMISYALGITGIFSEWFFDDFGDPWFDAQDFSEVNIPAYLFFAWVDPAIFAVVALVLQDRYRTYQKHTASTTERQLPIPPFILITWFLIAILVITSSASVGFYGTQLAGAYFDTDTLSLQAIHHVEQLSNQFWDAFVAFIAVTTATLLICAILVRKRAREDKIASITLFWIMPLLGARAIAKIIYTIIDDHFFQKFTGNDFYAEGLSSTIVCGGLHFIIACFLVRFLSAPRLWYGPGEETQQYGSYYGGSMQPVAQFPGQWGFVGQPQPSYPYPHYPQQWSVTSRAPPGTNYPNHQAHLAPPPNSVSIPEVGTVADNATPGTQTNQVAGRTEIEEDRH